MNTAFIRHYFSRVCRKMIGTFFPLGFMLFFLSRPACALEPWKGIFFVPQANTNNDHKIFLSDFDALVKVLKARGLNTIVFGMDYRSFHFTSDYRLSRYVYPKKRGFTFSEARRMAEIARAHGMQVMVALQVLTHEIGHTFPCVYPQYMLPGKTWQSGVSYINKVDFVVVNGVTYMCIKSHTSSPGDAPTNAHYWSNMCSAGTRDPFNKSGEAVVFKMVDELIDAFTVNGVKPEGFHMESDELRNWYDNPERETGKSSAQIFAMAITNVYNHIKANDPNMEVIMWGDMFDPKFNGASKTTRNPYARDTASAIDLIPKDIIIADWRYEANSLYSYDAIRGTFPSVGEFIDKGFRVWPTSWDDEKATLELVWTGNMEQARTGRVMGHLYNTCLDEVVPELRLALVSQSGQAPDSKSKKEYRKIADSIDATVKIVGAKQCRGTVSHCGAYPGCEDLSKKNDYYGDEFRDFSCVNNRSSYNIYKFPGDFVSYWKFDGDAKDSAGRNNGRLVNGTTFIKDAGKGQVASFDRKDSYVNVKNADSLNMGTGSVTLGAWFKTGVSSDYQAILSRHFRFNYTLFLTRIGEIQFNTNGSVFYRLSTRGIDYRDNKWHHVMAIFDHSIPTINIYVDGVISNGALSSVNGRNDKSSKAGLFIGNYDGLGRYQYQGTLNDVMLYNRALSPVEVQMVYTLQKTSTKSTNFK